MTYIAAFPLLCSLFGIPYDFTLEAPVSRGGKGGAREPTCMARRATQRLAQLGIELLTREDAVQRQLVRDEIDARAVLLRWPAKVPCSRPEVAYEGTPRRVEWPHWDKS